MELTMGEAIGIRELRQNASEIVRNLERGDSYTLTVQGREVGELRLDKRSHWVGWEHAKRVFDTSADPSWADDLQRIEGEIVDPWER
ncbi:MAG: hypothetical protein WC054_08145 [Candidatus Nanopelagicales bacterium]